MDFQRSMVLLFKSINIMKPMGIMSFYEYSHYPESNYTHCMIMIMIIIWGWILI